ncbi:hypothetical protein, partial [Paracoccus fontiphilus]
MTDVDQPPDERLAETIPLVFLQGCKWCPETVFLTVMVLVLYPLQGLCCPNRLMASVPLPRTDLSHGL